LPRTSWVEEEMNSSFRSLWLLAVVSCLIPLGCKRQKEVPRYPVSGTVTLDGKPLPEGRIYFKTVADGSVEVMDIKDGRFEGTAEAGDRRVEIRSYVTVKDPMGDYLKNTLPGRYNTESKITAVITKDGPNQMQFPLKKQ
jgi:hypothetical protein